MRAAKGSSWRGTHGCGEMHVFDVQAGVAWEIGLISVRGCHACGEETRDVLYENPTSWKWSNCTGAWVVGARSARAWCMGCVRHLGGFDELHRSARPEPPVSEGPLAAAPCEGTPCRAWAARSLRRPLRRAPRASPGDPGGRAAGEPRDLPTSR